MNDEVLRLEKEIEALEDRYRALKKSSATEAKHNATLQVQFLFFIQCSITLPGTGTAKGHCLWPNHPS